MKPIFRPNELSKKSLEKIGFKFWSVDLYKTKEGRLILSVDWTTKDDGYGTKYAVNTYNSHQELEDTVGLEFPEIPAPYGKEHSHEINHKATIELGIEFDNVKQQRYYSLEYFKATKYGALVYFAPRTWDKRKGKPIFSYYKKI